MSNNKQSSVEWLHVEFQKRFPKETAEMYNNNQLLYEQMIEQAKAMQQEQAQLYATFVLMCVNNNLPPITFNDWINLESNEETKNT